MSTGKPHNDRGGPGAAKSVQPTESGLSLNSARHWLPRLATEASLLVHLPRTVSVPYDHAKLSAVIEGEGEYPEWQRLVDQVTQGAEFIGWPVFIRSDLASAKHSGPEAYLARSKDDVSGVLYRTAEDNELKLWLSPEQPSAFLVREYLDLDAPFRAFSGLPIAREWRFCATAEKVLCAHPYWPEDAIKFRSGYPEPFGWQDRLCELHEKPEQSEWGQLLLMSRAAAAASGPDRSWSVDFAKDRSGNWWLIDMALMENSWHWSACPNAPKARTKYVDE